tara:strand:- start:266 stop:424 length:159 start_codon:yes stop_codon:yes gene_type:complete
MVKYNMASWFFTENNEQLYAIIKVVGPVDRAAVGLVDGDAVGFAVGLTEGDP